LLVFRRRREVEVLLVHPGGPFWAKKDDRAWSIPKGEFPPAEDPLAAARREVQEETGCRVSGDFIPLTPLKQPGGKLVHAWAVEGDCDVTVVRSNTFTLEWPPRSGRHRQFPEVDRAGWFAPAAARAKILPGQAPFLDELEEILEKRRPPKSLDQPG
jgi:predicted NUDIX family NTP pyrophosphohydrolase